MSNDNKNQQTPESQLGISTNADANQPANSPSFTNESIDNTPFRVIGNEEQGYALAMGQFRITDLKPTKDEAIEELSTNFWNMIIQIVTLTHEIILTRIHIDNEKAKQPKQN